MHINIEDNKEADIHSKFQSACDFLGKFFKILNYFSLLGTNTIHL